MKKIIYGAAVALLLGAAACGKSDDAQTSAKFFTNEATDSLLISLGQAAGSSLNASVSQAMATDSTASKALFLKGLQYGLAADSAEIYIQGVVTGLQLQNQLKMFRQLGLDVNPRVAVESFKKAFLDSVPDQLAFAKYQADYRKWTDSLMSAKRVYERALLENSPEAQENAEKGATFIKAQKAMNDSVQITPSGLGYKILNAGEGPKVGDSNRVMLKYTASTVGGVVVDRANGQPVNLNSRTAGLKEGVSLLSKGGKAVLYVPGKLAYGVDIPQGMPVQPNELIIYEVEVVDIPAAPDMSQR